MGLTTLCYVEQDEKYLMMHRVSKKNDVNKDKWIGIGGHFEYGESPEDCLLREAMEETGLTLTHYVFRGIVTFLCDQLEPEYMCLYTADAFTGELTDCEEGILEWVPKSEISRLNLWEGDRIFFRLLEENAPFFSLKLHYEHNVLQEAVLDGCPMELIDILNPDGTVSGRVGERTVIHREGSFHRTSHTWLVRGNRQTGYDVLLQKRAEGKDAFPGCYDISSAGHIPAGSDALESAVRELKEELGIEVSEEELHFVGTLEASIETEFYGKLFRNHELSTVFVLKKDVDIASLRLQEEEVESVRWIGLEDCMQGIHGKSFENCLIVEELVLVKDYLEKENEDGL